MVSEIGNIEEFLNASFEIQEEIETRNNNWKTIHHIWIDSTNYFSAV